MLKLINWLGSQCLLVNGAVVGWFLMGIVIGMIIGCILGIVCKGI